MSRVPQRQAWQDRQVVEPPLSSSPKGKHDVSDPIETDSDMENTTESNCPTAHGPCSKSCGSTLFTPILGLVWQICFQCGHVSLHGPNRVDPGGSPKPGLAPQQFHLVPDFEIG
jgi:hypothetical protein